MVRETNNVCFGQIAQETQVVVREDNKKDQLKRSTEDVSPPNFTERNSSYYERSSRLVADTDSYLRRSNNNNNTTAINNYQSSSNNNSPTNNPDNRSRTRDRLYRNGPFAVGGSSTTDSTSSATASTSSATTLLGERTSSVATSKINNSRVPPASWYEAAATYTNGPGGSGNADVSAANINHYQTAASTGVQATAATTNSTTTSSYIAYSYASSSPAHNNSTATTTTSTARNSNEYGIVLSPGGTIQQPTDKDSETNCSTTPPLLNRNKQKNFKSSSSLSGSAVPTLTTTTLTGTSTMTSSSTSKAPTSSASSLSATNNNNNNSSNQTANNSCSSISSTINSNTNNSLSGSSTTITTLATPDNTQSASHVAGILNAAVLAAAASNESSSIEGHKSSIIQNSSSNASASVNAPSNNPLSLSASQRSSRSAEHFHGRSTTSSSRSHSRSPSSYSSSHSSSSSSSSSASSHASSPVGGVEPSSSSANVSSSRAGGLRSLQSAVAVPGSSSALNTSGSNISGSSNSSSSSTSSSTPTGNPVVHSEDNRPLAIRVQKLPARSSDTSLKDGLFHEYKKHGKVTWVKVVGQNSERYALVCFKKPEDVEKALEVSRDKLFFGCKIDVEPYQGYDVEDNEFRPYEAELDEYHPKSTRTLFIGNLEKEITASELRQHFECFGEIIEIDIKKQGMSAYAFCQYSDIVSVVKAMRKMDGEHLGVNRIKLGFGKSMPTNCVWIDGIGEKISESHLQSQFSRYGAVSKVVVDRQRQLALVLYEQIQYAQTAVKEMRGATLRSRKLQVDFASRECQDAFYEKLEKQSSGSRFNRYESQSRSRASSFSRHQNSNDGCSPSNTPGSSSSSSAGIPSLAPVLSSAIVAGTSTIPTSNTTGSSTLASVVGQTSGNTTPARSRGSRSSRHTMDYDYLDTRRFRSYDEYSQGSPASHDDDASCVNHPSSNTNSYSGIGLRSDSPLHLRLGPIVNSSGKESSSEALEMSSSRRRCDKSPAKQKGDIRLFQKDRAVLLEQFDECPSSGDESIASPRKRIKIDHHSINSTSGLLISHSLDEQQPQHKNSNCDYLLNDPMHRKSEVRRLSESSSLNKYPPPQQNHHHSHHAVPPPHHHHHQQQQHSRRPSIDFLATTGGVGGAGNLSARHGSTSSSNSDHHPPPHQSSSMACKRRRVIGGGNSNVPSTSALQAGSSTGSNFAAFGNEDYHHHASRGRCHQLHSHHSHEASGGESADGSRPGTPLCDERPEVLPSEPRRAPRERPREPMVLPLPKFGIQFFQQYRNSVAAGNTPTYYHHHHGSGSFSSSSAAVNSTNSGSLHMLSNSLLNRGDGGISNSHSSHSSATTTSASTAATGSCYLPSPSTRYPPHWRPNNHHHHHQHHQQQHGGTHHGASGGATQSSSSSMVSPMRSRSLSSNSSDSDVPVHITGSPSIEERIRTLDEMYERWSGKNSNSTLLGPNVVKRHDFNHSLTTWQHQRLISQTEHHHHASNLDVRSTSNTASSSSPASRHKFLDIDVKEMQPSDIVKSLLAKKSIFDDDLQRLKKNQWYEPTSDSSQLNKNVISVCTSPGLPNFQATKAPVVGCTTTSLASSVGANTLPKPSGALLQRLSSHSPMNSPQASMSPYNSPSPSPSVTIPSLCTITTIAKATATTSCGTTTIGSQTPTTIIASTPPPTATGGTKCLQYPFPTHPPLPNTAAPVQSAQPIPPPPAESSKPSMGQPPLPPMEVQQPPQPPATSPTPSVGAGTPPLKPKNSALLKSLSVPPPPSSSAAAESRILTKSVSVPGSTNVGTVKSTSTLFTSAPSLEQKQPQQATTGNSSLTPNKSNTKEDTAKSSSHTSSSSTPLSETVVKRSEKSHKHNHRGSEDKKSSKSDRRKNSNSSQPQLSQASACESSDPDERDSKKERKERQERREKELRKQQEREEREREGREREERERLEKERIEKEKLEKERVEKERLERGRLEHEERERVLREKERMRKEEERAKEERERKEEKERKLKEQREREEIERREREENDRREREEQLRKERKEQEENEQKEKEKLERQRLKEEKERERKMQDETYTDQKRDINLLKEHQRRKEIAALQFQTKSGHDQTPQGFFRHGETERQNNKENSTEESSAMDTASVSSTTASGGGKHKNRKTSRNTSPVRHPKRRLSSQDSNASNSATTPGAQTHTDGHAKRVRIDLEPTANSTQTQANNLVNNVISERRDSREHHAKERNNKHNRMTSSSSGHKNNPVNSHDKDYTKHHRNKHHKQQTLNQTTGGESLDINVSKPETAEAKVANCVNKTEVENTTAHDMETKTKVTSLLSSDDEEISETPTAVPNPNKTPSGNHKHREHGSGGSGHHSRHKSSKREREHHREKKRHSTSTGPLVSNTNDTVPSTPPLANCNATDEALMSSSDNKLIHRRTSAQSIMNSEANAKVKIEHNSDRKLSRCSEERAVGIQPQTPSNRHNNFNKSTPQSGSRRILLSSAEDTDGGGGNGGGEGMGDDNDSDNRQHSIFDIPDDGPYVSMYDKVKARSCKNMQKQEEEKKIKAKFSQLKQSRAKREEKKRSASYDGDSDSDFEGASSEHQKHNRSGSSYKMLSGGLSSTDDDHDAETGAKTPNRDRRRSSQASSSANSTHPNRLCSDSDDNSVTQRRLKLQDNIRRLCDDGDDTSEDDLIRRHNTGLANKRLLHHTSRIASDSESQSDIKLKQEPIETSNDDDTSSPAIKHLKQKIKKEVECSGEASDFGEFKFKTLNSLCSSADEQQTTTPNIKLETTGDILSANEIKKEVKDFYGDDDYMQSEQKFHKSPAASASQHCSPELAKIKKHKKSKKRQKTPTQDSIAKEQIVGEALVKHSPVVNTAGKALLALTADVKNTKLVTSPCYDAFDELKRGETSVTHASTETTMVGEKKRHKERKEKKREKLRHMSADVVGSGPELDKMVYEKEKHRLKKSKKSKSVDIMRQTSAPTTMVNAQATTTAASPATSCTPQHKRSGGEKMEDIFGPISDEDDEDLTDSDIGGRDLNCITNRNTSSSNMTGPIVSAALNPYKQEPLTPKSHSQEENEENKQKLTCSTIIGASSHLDRVVERQHRKEKREKKRKEREKSRGSEHNQTPTVSSTKPIDDENSVDLDAAGRALEAQLMEDSDNKMLEDATPSTATTYRSDMTDVFRFSDGDENSLEMTVTNAKNDKKDVEKEHTTTLAGKNKDKKKKKKRSREEKHQRRESSSSNASQAQVAAGTASSSKLTVDVQAAAQHAQKSTEEQQSSTAASPLCKPSPSLPCLIGDDDEDNDLSSPMQGAQTSPNTPMSIIPATVAAICTTPSTKDLLCLTHLLNLKKISPLPKTPTTSNTSGLNLTENLNQLKTTPNTPTSSKVGAPVNTTLNTTPTSSIGAAANNLDKSSDSSPISSNAMASSSTASTSSVHTTQKKKNEIFIPGFDGKIDDRISESAVQSISAEFNTPLDSTADEPKIPVESPPDASKLEKLEESKSRATISQEETESAVSALLGESFGNSSAVYSFNDDDDLNNVITDPEPTMTAEEPDEEAALAAKAIECEVASSVITDTVEEDTEEVSKAIQSLRQEELDIKADTPQSVRDLQIDTDTEENVDEADSSGSNRLKIDETAQSTSSSATSDKLNTTNPSAEEQTETNKSETSQHQQKSSVITKVKSPTRTQPLLELINTNNEPKIEPPTISKQDQPAVQPVQAVMPSANLDNSVGMVSTTSTVTSSSITTTTPAGVTMCYTSTPIKTSITFAPNSTFSPSPKQMTSSKSITTSTGYVMQPPTITIPEPSTHFVAPQLVLSPRGVVTTLHNDSPTTSTASSTMHSPSGHHMPPKSPVGATYIMGVRAQSPHSPRQHTSRANTPTPRQPSPHNIAHAPPAPIVVTPQQQQPNVLLQRAVQQHQNLMSPPSQQQQQQHVTLNNSPLASPNMTQKQLLSSISVAQSAPHKVHQQHSPNTPEQQHNMIKINNYSTPTTHNANMMNIRIPASHQQQQQQQSSPQQKHATKSIEQQNAVPIGQHILPISIQKMPPVPTHPTIISKVVSVTPQQAQQSKIQAAGIVVGQQKQQQSPKGSLYSPPTSGGGHQSRQSPQILQQMGKPILQQQSPQMQYIQQRQQQQQNQQHRQQQQMQQHMMQIQQNQMIHIQQQQKLQQQQQQPPPNMSPQQQQQQPTANMLPQQQQSQTQHTFVASQQQQQQPQQRGLASPQQMQQHQTQMQQHQTQMQHQQLKVQYQQQQHHMSQQMQTTQQCPTQQQQNVIQNAQTPQRFLVQQHIVGMPQQHVQHQQHPPQTQSPNSQQQQQKPAPIYTKQQHLRQQSPSPQRLLQQQQDSKQNALESPRVIIATTPTITQTQSTSHVATKTNVEKQSNSPSIPTVNKQHLEGGVSVIRTPTPTSTLTTPTIPATNKELPTTTTVNNTPRSAPLTEENVIKISPPKHDEIEQDSKEDSDYWSAKELNIVETNTNTTSASTVIKKNETLTSAAPATPTAIAIAKVESQSTIKAVEIKSSSIDSNETDTKTTNLPLLTKVDTITSLDSKTTNPSNVAVPPASSHIQSGNVTTDHETEDETETQQMPTFEQVPIQGRPSTRGTGAKRGRQPRGGKKAAAAAVATIANAMVNANVNTPTSPQTELGPAAGVQTRLRKPTATTPTTRGRKGRPPRNLLLQQQQLQQQQEQQIISTLPQPQIPAPTVATAVTKPAQSSTASSNPVTTATEKKARSQTAASALTSLPDISQQQHQDVYEFHEESGDESKANKNAPASASTANPDLRPRLILSIKNQAQGTAPLVKALEKPALGESKPVTTSSTQVSNAIEIPQQQQDAATTNASQSLVTQPQQQEFSAAELAAAAATRKSRRILEKVGSTIDDTIEDVVRNTNTNNAGGNVQQTTPSSGNNVVVVVPNLLNTTLPKGAQTPPRRSGRNSSQPRTKGNETSSATNPIGRPRKSKDRKNTNDLLDIEQTPSPQAAKHMVHDISDVEDTKSVGTPPPPQVTTTTTDPNIQHSQTTSIQSQMPDSNNTPQQIIALPQHPKKKALAAAADIDLYQISTGAVSTSTTITPNIHSALPAGGVPMLNTAAPASQKTTGGAAESVNKPIIDPVTGTVSGMQMQQAKEGNLPSATAASQPLGCPMDSRKIMQAVAENSPKIQKILQNPSMQQGAVATPITALTKPVQVEASAAAAQAAATSVSTAMLNASVSVVVKTSNLPPTPPPSSTTVVMQQQQQQHQQQMQISQANQQQQQQQQVTQRQRIGDIQAAPTKQTIIMQQQTATVMHAQQTSVKPPTSLKAHVLNSQKLQQQQSGQQQQQQQRQYVAQQQTHQLLHQQQSAHQTGGAHHQQQQPSHQTGGPHHQQQQQQQPSHVIQRQTPPQQQLSQTSKQLLVNTVNTLNAPRNIGQQHSAQGMQQQQQHAAQGMQQQQQHAAQSMQQQQHAAQGMQQQQHASQGMQQQQHASQGMQQQQQHAAQAMQQQHAAQGMQQQQHAAHGMQQQQHAAQAMQQQQHASQGMQQQQHVAQAMQQQQQQSLVIKQGHDLHPSQVLHVVSSKTSAPPTITSNKQSNIPSTSVHHIPPTTSQQQPSYTTYIQTPSAVHTTQQQQQQQPIVIHQQTIGGPSKTTTTPLIMPPGMLGLPPHPTMVIQTKTSAPAHSPSGSSAAAAAHLQHPNQHAPSPPLQPQHLGKQPNSPMIHTLQSQSGSHVLNAVASPSPPNAGKPPQQQSSIASNVGASSLRTTIPTISPQSQARMGSILLPGSMQVPPHFEAGMHDISPYGSAVTGSVLNTQSPPPAHQQASPITPVNLKGEASFPGGPIRGVPTREHLMIYQQLLRQHDPLNPVALREFDDKLLGSSPPLELRRPGSVPRTVAVPHSLQSPQDRATDSPQVAQVYVHNTRLPAHTHYDVTGRPTTGAPPSAYYDATRPITLEPPPAHRPSTAHSVVAPPTVVVPHPSAGSSSPFMPSAPPATGVQTGGTTGQPPSTPAHHSKLMEREREQREREREQQLMREKDHIMVRTGDAHNMQVGTPPPSHQPSASHQLQPHAQAPPPPPQADSLLTLLQRYPVMWQGLLALKTDQAAVQMHFVFGNPLVARASLPCNSDGSTPPLRISQRMRLEQTQLEGVAKKMQFENEHCMLLALPCGRDHADVLQQSRNLQSGFITYLQQKMAAGIVNIAMPGSEQAAYVVHIFPSCDFANENLEKAAPDLKNRVADIAHLLIVIATV